VELGLYEADTLPRDAKGSGELIGFSLARQDIYSNAGADGKIVDGQALLFRQRAGATCRSHWSVSQAFRSISHQMNQIPMMAATIGY